MKMKNFFNNQQSSVERNITDASNKSIYSYMLLMKIPYSISCFDSDLGMSFVLISDT